MSYPIKKVLIVEDDLLLLLVQERLVKKLGYEVVGTACEGEAAYRMIKLYDPDIILMDINLDDQLKGTEVIEMIRKEGVDTPVIFVSGERSPEIVQKAEQLGCIDYLLKPISSKQLGKGLNKATEYIEQSRTFAA